MTNWDRYHNIYDKRYVPDYTKQLVGGTTWDEFLAARQKLAPIEWLGYPTRLRFDLRVDRPVRTIYWRRKKIKMICTEDALDYFMRIK